MVGHGWLAAHQIRPGDLLLGLDGQQTAVDFTNGPGGSEPVYNLEVEEYHTYLVGSALWGISVWAHNNDYVAPNAGSASPHPVKGMGNIGSHGPIDPSIPLGAASKFLGPGYTEIAPGVFRSADVAAVSHDDERLDSQSRQYWPPRSL